MENGFGTLLSRHWLDIIFFVLLACRVYQGFRNGFVIELSRTIAFFVGFALAGALSGELARWLTENLGIYQQAALVVAYMLIVLVVFLVAMGVGRIVHLLVDLVLLGWLNHTLGPVLAFLTGLLTVQAVVLLLGALQLRRVLVAAPIFVNTTEKLPLLFGLLPANLVEPVRSLLHSVLQTLP